MKTQVQVITKMQGDIEHLKDSFDEYKEDNLRYHDEQAKKADHTNERLDEISKQYGQLLGLQAASSDVIRIANSQFAELKTTLEGLNKIFVTKEELELVKQKIDEVEKKITAAATREEVRTLKEWIRPVKIAVYGVLGLFGAGVVAAFVDLLRNQPNK